MFGVNVFGTAGKRADKRLQDACEDLPVKEEGGRWRALSPPGRLERWEDETGKRLRPRPPPRREGRPESRRAPAAALASPCLGTAVGFRARWAESQRLRLPASFPWGASEDLPGMRVSHGTESLILLG